MVKIFKIIAGIVVVLIVAIVITINLIDLNKYKAEVIQIIEDKTGRDFDISGEFNFGVSLVPTLFIEGVTFANADWGSQKNMLSVGRLEVEVALIPLLSNTIHVRRLELVAPEVYLETDKKGKGNWVLDIQKRMEQEAAKKKPEQPTTLPSITVNEVGITDAKITYKDGKTGKITKVVVEEISMEAGGFNDPMELIVKAAFNDIPIALNGSMGSIDKLLTKKDYPLNLNATVSEAVMDIDGKIADLNTMKGMDMAIDFKINSLARLSKLTESELPDYGPIHMKGKFSDIDGGYALKSFVLKAGPSDLSGDITVKTAGKRPALNAKLKSNLIDLAALAGEEEKKKEEKKAKGAKVFPSEPIPLAGLKAADVDISLNAAKIKTNAAVLEKTKLVLKLNNGKLSISPLSTNVAGGTMDSAITLDGSSGKSASLSINVKVKNLQPGMLNHLKGKITGAITDITINAKGSGKSLAAIMSGLNGNVLLKMSEGDLKSSEADAATSSVFLKTYRMLNPGAKGDQGSKIKCGVVKLDIKDGIAPVDKGIALETNRMNILGSGSINFKTEELDLGVTPQAREGAGVSVGQLAELVRLKGTFANPSIVPDTKAAVMAGVSAGVAVATGGLSILGQGLFDRSTADSDPCATALGLKTAQKSAPKKAPETEKSTTQKAVDTVKDVRDCLATDI
jgi:uncharacterized protein involved in outer membrane biogenesis